MMIQNTMVATRTFDAPIPMPVAIAVGELFDDVMRRAYKGDTLKCVLATSGDDYFTEGESYRVVSSGFSNTVRDNEGLLIPRSSNGRVVLFDRFELMKNEPTAIFNPNIFANAVVEVVDDTVSMTEDEHAELKNWAFKGASAKRVDLMDDIRSYKDEIIEINNTNGFETPFKDLDDEDTGALLLAQFKDKNFQFKSLLGSWLDAPKGAFNFNADTAYRVRPNNLGFLEDLVKELETEAADTLTKINEFRPTTVWSTPGWC